MMKLLIVAALAACCLAAPPSPTPTNSADVVKPQDLLLKRPSPINPNVPSDPKPAESKVVITEPKAITKHKRESGNVKPEATRHDVHEHSQDHHQPQQQNKQQQPSKEKREDATHPSKPASNPDLVIKTPSTTAALAKRRPAESEPPRMSSSPAESNHRQRREEGAQTHLHTTGQEGHVAPQTQPAYIPAHEDDTHLQGSVPPQTLPVLLHGSEGAAPSSAHKRDIPVPLVAKHPHPDESPKDEEHRNVPKSQADRHDEHIEGEELSLKTPHTMHSSAEHHDLAQHDFQPPFHHHDLQQPHPHAEQSHEGSVKSHSVVSDTPLSPSTAEHPAIRHHPVPVAELFGNQSSKQPQTKQII